MEIVKIEDSAADYIKAGVRLNRQDFKQWSADVNAAILYLAALADTVPHRGTIDGHIKKLVAFRDVVQQIVRADKIHVNNT